MCKIYVMADGSQIDIKQESDKELKSHMLNIIQNHQ